MYAASPGAAARLFRGRYGRRRRGKAPRSRARTCGRALCSRADMHPELQSLAEAAGILTSYYDGTGELREARPEALVQVLRILGIDIRDVEDAAAAHVRFRASTWRELVPPCVVAWDAGTAELALSVPMAEQ